MPKNSNDWFGSFQEEINNVNHKRTTRRTTMKRIIAIGHLSYAGDLKCWNIPFLVATCLNKTAKAKLKSYIHIFRISLVLNN